MDLERHPHFYAENREVWRTWLEANSDLKSEIWLVLNKKGVVPAGLTLDQAVEEALCFGWIDGQLRRIDDRQHAVRFTPRLRNSRWSVSNKERVERMIRKGRMTPAGMALVDHARRTGEWDRASGTLRDWEMPAELVKELDTDLASREWFERLAPSHRRQFLGWIHEAKRKETRRRRMAKVLEMIRKRLKPGM